MAREQPLVRYSKRERALVYPSSPTGRLLCRAIEEADVFDGRTLAQELEARGFDVTTLRITCRKKDAPHGAGGNDG
jgi:hypothetical protein